MSTEKVKKEIDSLKELGSTSTAHSSSAKKRENICIFESPSKSKRRKFECISLTKVLHLGCAPH